MFFSLSNLGKFTSFLVLPSFHFTDDIMPALVHRKASKMFSFLFKSEHHHHACSYHKSNSVTIIPREQESIAAVSNNSSSSRCTLRTALLRGRFPFNKFRSVINFRSQKQQQQQCSACKWIVDKSKAVNIVCLRTAVAAPAAVAPTAPCHIEQLPLELVHLVLQQLDCTSIMRLSQTCKHFHLLCEPGTPGNNRLWKLLLQMHFTQTCHPQADAFQLYRNHLMLSKRWKTGTAKTRYLTGHTDGIYCIVRYQHYLVSGSRDTSIKVWDLRTNECVATRTSHTGSVLCLRVVSTCSQQPWMISGSSDSTCIIWQDLPDLKMVAQLRGHTSGVLDVCIVQDTWIVTASRDSSVRVWDKQSGKQARQLLGHRGPVNALQEYNGYVVTASGDCTLKLWDVVSGKCLRTFEGHKQGLACARVDGRYLYSGGQDTCLRIWDIETGACLSTVNAHDQLVRTVHSHKVW